MEIFVRGLVNVICVILAIYFDSNKKKSNDLYVWTWILLACLISSNAMTVHLTVASKQVIDQLPITTQKSILGTRSPRLPAQE